MKGYDAQCRHMGFTIKKTVSLRRASIGASTSLPSRHGRSSNFSSTHCQVKAILVETSWQARPISGIHTMSWSSYDLSLCWAVKKIVDDVHSASSRATRQASAQVVIGRVALRGLGFIQSYFWVTGYRISPDVALTSTATAVCLAP